MSLAHRIPRSRTTVGFNARPIRWFATADHGFSAGRTSRTREGRILQDADRLDAIGAISIARCFSVGARIDARLHHPNDPLAEERALDDGAYSKTVCNDGLEVDDLSKVVATRDAR